MYGTLANIQHSTKVSDFHRITTSGFSSYQKLQTRGLHFAVVLLPTLDEVAPEHLVAVDVLLHHVEVLSPGGTRSFVRELPDMMSAKFLDF